jgi:Cu/Zn superoxide dismutase
MKRAIVLLVLVAGLALAPTAAANDAHVKATLVSVSGSGVTGFVQLHQAQHGGTRIDVHAKGLTPGSEFASFYYDNADCTAGPDLVGTFTANPAGNGRVNGEADDDLDEIGSVSVRVGPGYGALLACAAVH